MIQIGLDVRHRIQKRFGTNESRLYKIRVFTMLTIRELDPRNIQDANKCDGTFTIDSKLVLNIEKDALRYTVASLMPFQKRYPFDTIEYRTYYIVKHESLIWHGSCIFH